MPNTECSEETTDYACVLDIDAHEHTPDGYTIHRDGAATWRTR